MQINSSTAAELIEELPKRTPKEWRERTRRIFAVAGRMIKLCSDEKREKELDDYLNSFSMDEVLDIMTSVFHYVVHPDQYFWEREVLFGVNTKDERRRARIERRLRKKSYRTSHSLK